MEPRRNEGRTLRISTDYRVGLGVNNQLLLIAKLVH